MTVYEFKKDHPEFAHLEGDRLWDLMGDYKSMQQNGDLILSQIKPFWKRYRLRHLFYYKRSGSLFLKYSSRRCIHCKKADGFGYLFTDTQGQTSKYHVCGKEWITEPNTSLSYRVYCGWQWVQQIGWRVLDALHLVRIGERYGMMGDEGGYVNYWKLNMNTGEAIPVLKSRKWWEYILIKK